VYRQYTNVSAGRLIKPGVLQVGELSFRAITERYCRPVWLNQ